MADDGFPLPGSSYKELCKIIAGYSETSGPSSPIEVSKLTGIHETQVSRSNKFLVAIHVVQGGQKKACTELGNTLGRALHFNQEDVVRESWKKVYSETDFFQKIVSSVRIRKGMEESALLSHIAFTSGNSKSGNAMAGAGAVVEILRIVGVIEGKGGTIVAVDPVPEPDAKSSYGLVPLSNKEESHGLHQLYSPAVEEEESKPRRAGQSSLQIILNISCTPDQLEGLGHKLRTLRDEYHSSSDLDAKIHLNEVTDPEQTEE